MDENKPIKRAVVLSGGGANGAYEAGVLKVLFSGDSDATGKEKEPIEVDLFTGTSVGSFNAGILVSRTAKGETCEQAANELEKLWIERLAQQPDGCDNGVFRIRADFLDYFNPKCVIDDPTRPFRELAEDSVFFAKETFRRTMHFLKSDEPIAKRSLEFLDLSNALCTTPLHDLVSEIIDVEAILSSEAKDLFVIATNWNEGKPFVFKNKESEVAGSGYETRRMTEKYGHHSILASTAIPGVFPPVRIDFDGGSDPTYFVDGGVVMNTPLSPAIHAGANEIHVVYFDPKLEDLGANYLPNTLDTANRLLFITVANLVQEDIEEVRKVNRQKAIADKIEPIIDRLKKEHEEQLEKKNKEVKDSIDRAEEYVDELASRKQVTVHKYFPSESLGGLLGLLDFQRERMQRLVDLGAKDARDHDCEANGCVLAEA